MPHDCAIRQARRDAPPDTAPEEAAIARLRIEAPPLEPDLALADRDLLPFLTLGAIFAVAGLAYLTGAPLFVSLALLVIGACGFAVLATLNRTFARLGDSARKDRTEIETLADRMWELQESEERFTG